MPDETGRSFGAAAEAYERGRPEWPEELLDTLPLGPEAEVLDLGAGTGKLTRVLARRYARVVAVEPDERLRALIPAGEPLAGTAEAIPLGEAAVDAVFAGESFHWFDREPALAEIRRVLRPGGILALLWNRFDRSTDVFAEDVLPPSNTPEQRLFSTQAWEQALGGEVHEAGVDVEREVPRAELLDYFASISPVTSLPPGERAAALARIAAALDRPSYPRRWTATLYWTRLPS